MGTECAGLHVYDKQTDRFFRIAHKPADPTSLSNNNVRKLEELRDGRMLVVTDGGGFNIVEVAADFFPHPPSPHPPPYVVQ